MYRQAPFKERWRGSRNVIFLSQSQEGLVLVKFCPVWGSRFFQGEPGAENPLFPSLPRSPFLPDPVSADDVSVQFPFDFAEQLLV